MPFSYESHYRRTDMKEKLMAEIIQAMLPHLDNAKLVQLKQTLEQTLSRYDVNEVDGSVEEENDRDLIEKFISAKRIEGCSEKSLKYYRATIEALVSAVGKNVKSVLTEDLRTYLTEYQNKHQSSRVTIDNIRRILSSFFPWLEDEDYIIKSPVRRIHKVKTTKNVKDTFPIFAAGYTQNS